jgi:hypothetical protein
LDLVREEENINKATLWNKVTVDQPEGSKNIVPLGLELGLALGGISPFGSFFWFFVFQRFFDSFSFFDFFT